MENAIVILFTGDNGTGEKISDAGGQGIQGEVPQREE